MGANCVNLADKQRLLAEGFGRRATEAKLGQKKHDQQSHRARLCKNDSNWPSSNQLKEFKEQKSDKKLKVSQRIQVTSSNFLNVGPLSPSKPLLTTAHHGLVDEINCCEEGQQ